MNKLFLATIMISGLSLVAFKSATNGELPIGSSMPKADVKLTDISGKEITLKSATKENGLLVMFTCNTCPYVIKNQSRTKEVCQYAASKGIGVILLNSNEGTRGGDDSMDEMKAYAKDQ